MAAFSTSYGKTFEVIFDKLNTNCVQVCDATSLRPIYRIAGVKWWDKDSIVEALEEHKDKILSKIEAKEKTPSEKLEEILSDIDGTMPDIEYIQCQAHIHETIKILKRNWKE